MSGFTRRWVASPTGRCGYPVQREPYWDPCDQSWLPLPPPFCRRTATAPDGRCWQHTGKPEVTS